MLAIYCRTSKESETSIEQQKKIGIQFALKNKFEYQVYEDEGISGFKISDDDIDPFNNRPSFTSLINDIKSKKINQVWVYEHSRLSRNQYASAMVFNVFEKFNIELYENGRKLDLNDPQFQMMRQILDAISQYERHLIVNRTTRGLHNAMDRGTRGYSCFYGYEKIGKDDKGKQIWKPVKSELNIIKYAYQRFLDGVSYGNITRELYDKKLFTDIKIYHRMRFLMSTFLSHFEYTGYTFNREARIIWKKTIKGENKNVHILNNPKYYTKSKSYTEILISIDDWFKVFEKIIAIKTNDSEKKKTGKKRAKSSLATGIIKCSHCGLMYYYRNEHNGYKDYLYYKHISSGNLGHRCKQSIRVFPISNADEMFKLFFFCHHIIFPNREEAINKSLFQIKQEIAIANEKLKSMENTIKRNSKQIIKFQKAIDTTDDIDVMQTIGKRLSKFENDNDELIKEKASLIVQVNELQIKYSGTELDKVYYNVKETVNDFFYNSDNEIQRISLLKIIKHCYAYMNYILIDNGHMIYLFDKNINNVFDMSLLDNLNRDYLYKKFFTDMDNIDINDIEKIEGKRIMNVELNKGNNRELAGVYLNVMLNINYDISEHTNLILFIELKGLLQFGDEIEHYRDVSNKEKVKSMFSENELDEEKPKKKIKKPTTKKPTIKKPTQKKTELMKLSKEKTKKTIQKKTEVKKKKKK